MAEPHDFYHTLGVTRQAGYGAIKAAYVRRVRQFPPERYPEEFKRLREAYETLSSPQARSEYDAASDPSTKQALAQAQAALENGDYPGAAAGFKRVLVVQPDAHFARNLLGLAYLYLEDYEAARLQFTRLTDEVPDNPTYWLHRAFAEHKLERYRPAERSYERVLKLGGENEAGHLGVVRVLIDQQRYIEAENRLESAIQADGVVDFDDLSFFFELIKIRILEGDAEGVGKVAARIVPTLSEEWQKNRVAYRFAQLASELVELKAFTLALSIAQQSERLAPGDQAIRDLTAYIRQNAQVIEQWERLQNDPEVRQGFKYVLAVILQTQFEQWESEAEKDSAIATAQQLLMNEMETAVPGKEGRRTLADELQYIAERYPAVEHSLSDQAKNVILASRGAATYVHVTCPHCGYQGRTNDQSARLNCPGCGRAFDYDRSKGEAMTWSASVEATNQGIGCGAQLLIYAVLAIVFAALAESCPG